MYLGHWIIPGQIDLYTVSRPTPENISFSTGMTTSRDFDWNKPQFHDHFHQKNKIKNISQVVKKKRLKTLDIQISK
jgi:hypothetical protein